MARSAPLGGEAGQADGARAWGKTRYRAEMARGRVLRLGRYPTPIHELTTLSTPETRLFVKRDDVLSDLYGGNKVRKLEYIFGAAADAGKRRLLTLGAAGSHQLVAMAIFGAREGFEVEAVVVPQPATAHAESNLRVALAHGLVAHPARAWALAPIVFARRRSREHAAVPLGGSNATGSLGYVDAAHELAAQVRAGAMPEPDVLVVALGSGGTAAGLAVGLEEAGLRTRVVAVAISHPALALSLASRRLAMATARLRGDSRSLGFGAARRIEVDARWVGRGYGYPTAAGEIALAEGGSAGLVLDSTYTAKAFACALARVRSKRHGVVLYWHTLSTVPRTTPTSALPPRLLTLLRRS